MQVILTKDVDTLGAHGDVLEVSDGHYRNFLGPKKLAVIATPGALTDLDRRIARIRAKAEQKHQEDLAKAAKLNALELITLEANAGDTGKLYGAITTKDLGKILHEKTGFEIDRRNVNVDHPVNKVGHYTVYVKFSPKVSAQVKLEVKALKTKHQQQEEFTLEDAFSGDWESKSAE